ncbi:PaaX family transcriptional regulator C-terminal domain-containing protein [Pseudonocardia nematodicida]|uniref:PaaX family transcriptional regulator C-terminal domain-containing protein n=1 Tax=Pseudonocardia nematodicida TaxID=1206997 RepID=A0ABV1KJT5_9PSEU
MPPLEIAGSLTASATESGPQHLLLTVLGDYWFPHAHPAPSGVLVGLLGEFGMSEANTRAALSRMSRRGLLDTGRQGRRTTYALSDSALRTLQDGTRRIFTFGDRDETWDGTWTIVLFSVPESDRAVRSALRVRLGWEGFAPMFDGVWVAPGVRDGQAAALLAELEVTTASVVVGHSSTHFPTGNPARAWDLTDIHDRYSRFAATFAPLDDPAVLARLGPREAFLARTVLMDTWREFPAADPELPRALLPDDWPLAEAHDRFTRIYDALGPAAEGHVRSLLAAHDDDLGATVSHHTSRTALTLC